MSLTIKKRGLIIKVDNQTSMWSSHTMAPTPILLDENTIRIFVGGWTKDKISRVWHVDVLKDDPTRVLSVSKHPDLDIGTAGCFDENGVFPAHCYRMSQNIIHLYYTGFQIGHKIRHYNFGGLAISHNNGASFERYSEAPVLDRADEGLFVRAGQSIERADEGGFHSVYSAGSSWHPCGGELRPVYNVFYQRSRDGIQMNRTGTKIITCDFSVEHGLGRPQIIRLGDHYYVFYTRRVIKEMRYFLGCARSRDCVNWERVDESFYPVHFGATTEFDSEMIYFPAVIQVSKNKGYLFYSGNYFGRDGMGLMEITF